MVFEVENDARAITLFYYGVPDIAFHMGVRWLLYVNGELTLGNFHFLEMKRFVPHGKNLYAAYMQLYVIYMLHIRYISHIGQHQVHICAYTGHIGLLYGLFIPSYRSYMFIIQAI